MDTPSVVAEVSVEPVAKSTPQAPLDRLVACLWLAISAAVMSTVPDLGYSAKFGPGAGFFPFWVAALLMLLSCLLLANSFSAQARAERVAVASRKAAIQMGLVLTALVVFVFSIETVGFLPCTFLFFFFLLSVVERRGWLESLGVPVIATFILWLVFVRALGTELPPGLLDLLGGAG